jgi:hypothetical protein
MKRERVPMPRSMPPVAMELEGLLLKSHPEERLSLPQIFAHEWLQHPGLRKIPRELCEQVADDATVEMLLGFGYEVDAGGLALARRNPETAAACRIVERKLLEQQVEEAVRDVTGPIRALRARQPGPLTPPPGMRRISGRPVQVPESAPATPKRVTIAGRMAGEAVIGGVPHAVTLPATGAGRLRRRSIR